MTLTPQQQQAMELIQSFIDHDDRQVFILKGYAGTGKTTLVGCIVEWLLAQQRFPQLMAPTGRAAKMLSASIKKTLGPRIEEIDCFATTIHKGIYVYKKVDEKEEEGLLKFIFPLRESEGLPICIVDEASMISSKKVEHEIYQFGTGVLIDDLLTYARPLHGGKLIFVGDPAQLPPVGDNRSAALDESFFMEKGLSVDSFTLTDIIRQSSDSLILTNATVLRNLLKKEERNTLLLQKREGEVMDMSPGDVANAYRHHNLGSSAIVCYSNSLASQYNKAVRELLFPGKQDLVAGDRLMIVRNNYYLGRMLFNGEIVTVLDVSNAVERQSAPVYTEEGGKKVKKLVTLTFRRIRFQTDDGEIFDQYIIDSLLKDDAPVLGIDEVKALYINFKIRMSGKSVKPRTPMFTEALKRDMFYNALQVKYGYAFTCHKAQGGEWNSVYVDFMGRTGLDIESLRWKYTAITRAKKTLLLINHQDITPLSGLRFDSIGKVVKYSKDALSFRDNVRETPFHQADAPLALKWKYWSVVWNMAEEAGGYAVRHVSSLQYMERYEVDTPRGEGIVVDAIYNDSWIFTSYRGIDEEDEALRAIFEREDAIAYNPCRITPKFESMKRLHARMVSLCDELGITLTNVVEGEWDLTYFMKATGHYASLKFSFNKKGYISSGKPMSTVGEGDEKLHRLINRLKEE